MGMLAVAKDKLDRKLRRRKLQGGSGVSPLAASDPVTGLYYERARWYSPSLGTWTSQDPLSYINGANTYQFVMSDPVGGVDPSGLWHWYEPWTWPMWHSTPVKAAVDTAREVPPGGEFCEAAEGSYNALSAVLRNKLNEDIRRRSDYDQNQGIAQNNDQVYTALDNFREGRQLTPLQQGIVNLWVSGNVNVNLMPAQ